MFVVTTALLRLYVVPGATRSTSARKNLDAFLAKLAGPAVDLEIVDVASDPDRALRDGVLFTPTLVKVHPGPEQWLMGDLTDESALYALGFDRDGQESAAGSGQGNARRRDLRQR
jgi:circadian clock protein KaiB